MDVAVVAGAQRHVVTTSGAMGGDVRFHTVVDKDKVVAAAGGSISKVLVATEIDQGAK